MSTLIAFLAAWIVITLLGHGSWVLIRSLFIKTKQPPAARHVIPPPQERIEADRVSFHHMLNRLVATGLLASQQADQLRAKADQLVQQDRSAAKPGAVPRVVERRAAEPRVPTSSIAGSNTAKPSVAHSSVEGAAQPVASAAERPQAGVPQSSSRSAAPVVATLCAPNPPAAEHGSTNGHPQRRAARAEERVSLALVIREFLVAHNIRWGELIAGMLIVVCSIGLVISLWNPLTQSHRVFPSLIFMGGNAAVYAAGLYMLRRWKLRHTSRAVLVIATLLTPLSVLAGLSVAGSSLQAVSLVDPLTLATLFLAAAVYGFFLLRTGRTLFGTYHGNLFAAGVATAVAVLPLIPAAIRLLSGDAGWIVGIASLAIATTTAWDARLSLRRHDDQEKRIGPAGGRNRILILAVSTFTLATVIGYATFLLRTVEAWALLSIALATIPALLSLAASARVMAEQARRTTQAITANVFALSATALACLMLPACWHDVGWLWTWGGTMTLSGVALSMVLRRSRWSAVTSIPLCIAATLSAPAWSSGIAWQDFTLWRSVFAGESLMVVSLIAMSAGISSRLAGDTQLRLPLTRLAAGWAVAGLAIATVVSVHPVSWLGAVPAWCVTAVVTIGLVVAAARSLVQFDGRYVAIATVTAMCLSVLRPTLFNPLGLDRSFVWLTTSFGIAICLGISTMLLVVGEIVVRVQRFGWGDPRLCRASIRLWTQVAAILALTAASMATALQLALWPQTPLVLGGCVLLLLWSSVREQSRSRVLLAQLASVALAIVIGYGRFPELLLERASWSTGAAIWAWSILGSLIVFAWMLVRELSRPRRQFRWMPLAFLHAPDLAPGTMLEAAIASASVALISLAAVLPHADLWWQVGWDEEALSGHSAFSQSFSIVLPLLAFACVSAMVVWLRRYQWEPRRTAEASVLLGVSGMLWLPVQLGLYLPLVRSDRLSFTTTVASVGCLGVAWLVARQSGTALRSPAKRLPLYVTALLLVCSSAALLTTDWIRPLLDGQLPVLSSTVAVTSWWALASVGLLLAAARYRRGVMTNLSALLLPTATIIAAPLLGLTSPMVWIQLAGLASAGWLAASYLCIASDSDVAAESRLTCWLATVAVGIGTCWLALFTGLFRVNAFAAITGESGLAVSLVALVPLVQTRWVLLRSDAADGVRLDGIPLDGGQLTWPMGLTLLSGHLAWLGIRLGVVADWQVPTVVAAGCSLAAVGAMIGYWRQPSTTDFWHSWTSLAAVSLFALAADNVAGPSLPWVGLVSIVAAGALVAVVARGPALWMPQAILMRLLGVGVGVLGTYFLVERCVSTLDDHAAWTMVVAWLAGWLVTWRVLSPDGVETNSISDRDLPAHSAVPDLELNLLLLTAVVGELIVLVFGGGDWFVGGGISQAWMDAGFIIRMLSLAVVVVTSWLRSRKRHLLWQAAVGGAVILFSTLAVRLSLTWEPSFQQRLVVGCVSAGVSIAMLGYLLPSISRGLRAAVAWLNRSQAVEDAQGIEPVDVLRPTCQVAVVVALLASMLSVGMMAGGAQAALIQITIATGGLGALAIAELAEQGRSTSLRYTAVFVGLVTLGLWASVDAGESIYPWLAGGMRWLVVSVLAIPTLVFLLPWLLGRTTAQRWQAPFQWGATVAAATAAGSALLVLVLEFLLRSPDVGIVGLPPSLVAGVAVTFACLSMIAGLVAILAGPGSSRLGLAVTDNQRRGLIVASQVLAAVTWLHVYLCDPAWAFIGPRGYWPYAVMGLAFASVGAAEWARRRNDQVLSETIRRSSLYLPLIPVLGFWLARPGDAVDLQGDWRFVGGEVGYASVLAVAAIYYVMLAVMWRGVLPRVLAIVLANGALWITLLETPGWSFLMHPQAWLIPPAVCLLIVTHFSREKLPHATVSAIRYAATLVIYVSSTADMLIADLGKTMWGPVVLICLALAGMAAGVVLRVKPFLYLGALFVFIAVTSMVWHAQQAIDATWPWWVFGISLGICLLAGLMAIEKNKPKLRRLADSMATWET